LRNLIVASNGADEEKGADPALLVVGHGSRDPRGARDFHELVALVKENNPALMVEGGFIELSRPPISECVNRLAEGGARRIAAVRTRKGRHPRNFGAREDETS
jgi:CbiX